MKKARLMLSALSIMAILATAFAFKTAKFEHHVVFTGLKDSGSCTVRLEGVDIVDGTPNVAASLASTTTGCPNAFTIAVTD